MTLNKPRHLRKVAHRVPGHASKDNLALAEISHIIISGLCEIINCSVHSLRLADMVYNNGVKYIIIIFNQV